MDKLSSRRPRLESVHAGAGAGGGRDKLSSLGDAVLGHILSFLPATEAARTATLSRRWRHVFAAVHTLSFGEAEGPFAMGYEWWRRCSCCDNGEVPAPHFVAGVSAALNGRHRGARAATAPLRALRVAFDEFGFRGGDDTTKAVDGWFSYAVNNGAAGEAMEIDLRLGTEPICDQAYALDSQRAYTLGYQVAEGQDDATDAAGEAMEIDLRLGTEPISCDQAYALGYQMAEGQDDATDAADDEDDAYAAHADDDDDYDDADDDDYDQPGTDEYVVPRSLFSCCAVLRALRLGRCWIDLPSAISLPSLDTLHLTRVTGRRGGGDIQRLVSACPSLADLTLEACKDLTALSVDGALLRRLALRCCHDLHPLSVFVGSTELRAFEYRGTIPPAYILTMHPHAAPRRISFCAFDFCGVECGAELFGLTDHFVAGVERLHVTSARLGSCFVSQRGVSPCLPMLRALEITGMLPDDDEFAVATVARILEGTPRLETLSLFFLPEPRQVKIHNPFSDAVNASHELRYDPHARLAAAPPRDVEIPCCLRETTMEINLVHYQGSVAQRELAKFLLCNAAVVKVVFWKVAGGPLSIQTKLMEEVRGWVMNKSANMMFF